MYNIITLLLFFFTSFATAHTNLATYLEIQSSDQTNYNIFFKVPIVKGKALAIYPTFPSICQEKKQEKYQIENNNMILTSWTIKCTESLMGEKISINNIEKSMVNVLIYFNQKNQISYYATITPSHSTIIIKQASSTLNTLFSYIFLGIKHILSGYDHLLFVLGLLLIIQKWKMLIKTITAFTLAHSITLGLTILGYIYIQSALIESMIALSIVVLAIEIIYTHHDKIGFSSKFPWMIAFFFGLIHGFGFATVLTELGLTQNHLFLTLFSFNVGIEIGQLFFIMFLILFYYALQYFISKTVLMKSKIPLAYLIGTLSTYWFIERISSIY